MISARDCNVEDITKYAMAILYNGKTILWILF